MADAAAAAAPPQDPDDDEERRRRQRQAAMERMLLAQEEEEEIVFEHPPEDPPDIIPVQQQPLLQQHPLMPQEQPKPIKPFSYTHTSFFVAACVLYYALRTRQQWYLALVYLSSSKAALVVMGNAVTAAAVSAFDLTTNTFLSGLRIQEAEGLKDFFRWNVTETCLALTMFRSELSGFTALQFLALVTIKCLHHVAVMREQHVRMTADAVVESTWTGLPTIPSQHLKLLAMLIFLQFLDILALQVTVQDLLKSGPNVSILFAFEAAILLVSAWSHILLWSLHVTDSWLNYHHDRAPQSLTGRWIHLWKEYKATLIFAVELQAQSIQFLFYLMFFGIVLTYYGMPINLFREVYISFVQLTERLKAFLNYRRLMASMNRFADVTDEQLDQAGRTCIICRDEMHQLDCKQLPTCQHLFHKSCLREWLVQQQTCPTCRSTIGEAPAPRRAPPPEPPQEEPADDAGPQEDDLVDDIEGEEIPDVIDETTSPQDASNNRRDKRVRFEEQRAAASDHAPSFPGLYRVVRDAGAPVYSNGSEAPFWIRTVPFGVVVLCQALKEQEVDGDSTVLLRIPDGWIPSDAVLHVHSLKR